MQRAALPGAGAQGPPGPFARPRAAGGARAWRRLAPVLELACMLAAGTALSWALTGHVLGRSNNVFHLPIVAGLAAQPGFAGDAFVQSLAGFASGLWMLLEGRATPSTVPLLFALGLAASKALTLLSAVAVARTLGLEGRWRTLAFIGVLATTPLLQGAAYAGHGGLFVDFFSHSELANGVMLLAWWASLRQRHGLALALIGGVCFLNAFMAAWNLLPWLWLLLADRRRRRWRWRDQLRPLATGLAVALLWAAPVAWRLAAAGLYGESADPAVAMGAPGTSAAGAAAMSALPDLREFVRGYYPYHFLADEMPLPQWVGLAAVTGAALVAFHWLGPGAAGLRALWMAYAAVYMAGVLAPLLGDAPVWIRLHLLRSSVSFHFIAAIALALVLVRPSPGPAWRRPLVAVALLTGRPAVALVVIAALLGRISRLGRSSRTGPFATGAPLRAAAGAPAGGAAALAAVGVIAWQAATLPARLAHTQALAESGRQWAALARRVGETTPPGTSVLLPLESDSWRPPDAGSGIFEFASGRSVWVDHKRGAAVLWRPSFHAVWRARVDDVAALGGWPERLRYAAARRLAMVVGRCDELPPGWVPDLHAGRLCAVRTAGFGARD